MKKIYIFIAHMGAGGAERVCVSLANEMIQMNREVHIIVLNLESDFNTHLLLPQCHVHSLHTKRLRYAALPMLRMIRLEKIETLLVFGGEMGIILNKLRKAGLIKVNLIERVLNNVNISLQKEDHVSKTVEKYLQGQQKHLGDMDYIIAQCEGMKEMLLKRNLVKPEHIAAIYNPYNRELISKIEDKQDKEQKQITFVGRLAPQKNIPDLLKAFEKIAQRRDDVSLHLVGDGPLKQSLQDMIAGTALEERVVFEGIRKDIENVYSKTNLIVLSSEYEGMPNCLIEAIAGGVPVVSYDSPIGPMEIVEDGVNGFLVPYMDVEALETKMEQALDMEWDKETIRATAGKFQPDHIAKRYLEVFDSI